MDLTKIIVNICIFIAKNNLVRYLKILREQELRIQYTVFLTIQRETVVHCLPNISLVYINKSITSINCVP